MLKSTYHSLFSKLSLPLWLVIVLSTAVPVLGAQPHRATSKVSAIDPLQTTEQINVNPTSLLVSEAGGFSSFTVTLDGAPTNDVTIGLSAGPECNVSESSVVLTSGNWSDGVTVNVTAVDDNIDDGTQACLVETGSSSSVDGNYNGLTVADVDVDVSDDDQAGFVISETALSVSEPNTTDSFNISLTSEPTAPVTINFSASNTQCTVSQASAGYNSGNWDDDAVLIVSPVDDDVDDGTQTCTILTSVSTSDGTYGALDPADIAVNVADDDEAGIAVSTTGFTISEPNESQSFSISLLSQPTAQVNIGISASNAQCSVDTPSVALTSGNWLGGVSVGVTAVDDSDVDGARNCMVMTDLASSTDGNYDGDDPPNVSVTVEDDDTTDFHFSTASYGVGESAGSVEITVELSTASFQTVSVDYATSNGSATAGADYTSTSGTLQFVAGDMSESFSVPILPDTLDEADETFTVALSNPSGADLQSPSTATVTITDDDEMPTVQFESASGYAQHEGAGTATIGVALSAPSGREVTVNYATDDISAIAGEDYTTASGSLTFNPGETSKSFNVPIISDGVDEPNETVNLELTLPANANATLGTPSTSTLTIIDDDDPPQVFFSSTSYSVNEADGTRQITVLLSESSQNIITVAFATNDGSATAGNDYTTTSGTLTFLPGDTSETFPVPILNDMMDEPTETIILALNAPSNATVGSPGTATLFIQDEDAPPMVAFTTASYSVNEGDGSATVTVVLNNPSGFTVSVDYATVSGGTATPSSDYTPRDNTLVFVPGQVSRTFTVPINDDAIDEPNETVNLVLRNPVSASLGTPSSSVLSILDNDGQTTVQFETTSYTVSEADSVATINVVLSGPSGFEVRVDYATSNGTAGAGVDYTAASGELVFAPGEILKTFQVPIAADMINEPDETVNLTLTNPVGAALGTPNDAAVLTIVDSNEPTTVQLSQATYTVSESMLTMDITVTLNVATTSSVSVAYETQAGTATPGIDFRLSTGVLVFSPGQTTQTFTIDIFPDQLDEPDETILLAISNAVNATLGEPATGTLTIVDDDLAPTVFLSLSSMTVDENDGFANAIVRLSAASGRTITVDYTTIAESAVAGSDFSPTAGTLTFSPGETTKTIPVPILDDNVDEPNETFRVNINTPTNATLETPTELVVTIVDADIPTFTRYFPAIFYNAAIGEPNNDCISAYMIKPYQTYFFLPDDFEDYYVVDISGSGDLVFELTNFVPLDGQLAVYKGNTCGERITLENNATFGSTKTVVVENQTSGRYYLYVANDAEYNFEDAYRLRVYFR